MSKPRRAPRRKVNGWIVLDKPFGMGSTEAVSKVKWLFNADKAGHAGTLDPLASGMLPIALGEATKTVPYVVDGGKTYRFTVAWGEERSTDDREGAPTATSDARPDEAAIRALLPRYTGAILQRPPAFSAIKVDGERAYDLARDGEMVELPAREVVIKRFELLARPDRDHAVFEVDSGKGAYVRALARDLGRDLGCYGHVAELRRISVAPFAETALLPLERLEA
ncbi:MAG: tRNA pseudouridine(55) synthase TruB, partial [Rhizobiaceae bacterium]